TGAVGTVGARHARHHGRDQQTARDNRFAPHRKESFDHAFGYERFFPKPSPLSSGKYATAALRSSPAHSTPGVLLQLDAHFGAEHQGRIAPLFEGDRKCENGSLDGTLEQRRRAGGNADRLIEIEHRIRKPDRHALHTAYLKVDGLTREARLDSIVGGCVVRVDGQPVKAPVSDVVL